MKLKVERINNHIALVSQSAEIKDNTYTIIHGCLCKTEIFEGKIVSRQLVGGATMDICKTEYSEIICAQKELNLDVPILPDWRVCEDEDKFEEYIETDVKLRFIPRKIADRIKWYYQTYFKHNKAKYTEDDLRRAIRMAKYSTGNLSKTPDEIIQSLQKYPQFIVIESIEKRNEEFLKGCNNFKEVGCIKDVCSCYYFEPKLITNSEGKQEVIIKQIIW